jgi:hypothetical protein
VTRPEQSVGEKYVVNISDKHFLADRCHEEGWDLFDGSTGLVMEFDWNIEPSAALATTGKWYRLEPLHTDSCPWRKVECMRCSSVVEQHCMRTHDCGHRTYPVRSVEPVRRTDALCDCRVTSFSFEDDSVGGRETLRKISNAQRSEVTPPPPALAKACLSGDAPTRSAVQCNQILCMKAICSTR